MTLARLAFAICLTFWSHPAGAQGAVDGAHGVEIRAFVEADGEIVVGQLIRVIVEVSTPTWFTAAPAYPEIHLDGAIVLLPEQFGVNFSDRKGGQTISGQRQRYAIIPQRAGTFRVAPITVSLATTIDGKPTERFAVSTPPVQFSVVMPAEAADVSPLVTTASLTVSERYEGSLDGLKVGDAITRSVTVRARDTFGLALPPTRFAPVDGLAVYPAQPRIEDKVARGRYSATRTDSATYVLQKPGTYILPAITVRWWSLDIQSLDARTLEARTISVAPGAAAHAPAAEGHGDLVFDDLKRMAGSALEWTRANIIWLTCIGGAIALLRSLSRRFGPAVIAAWHASRTRRRTSEPYHFAAFRRSCLSGNEGRIRQTFWRWLTRLVPAGQTPVLSDLVKKSADGSFAQTVQNMERQRYSRQPERSSPRGLSLYFAVSGFRRHFLSRRHKDRPTLVAQGLNPSSSGE